MPTLYFEGFTVVEENREDKGHSAELTFSQLLECEKDSLG